MSNILTCCSWLCFCILLEAKYRVIFTQLAMKYFLIILPLKPTLSYLIHAFLRPINYQIIQNCWFKSNMSTFRLRYLIYLFLWNLKDFYKVNLKITFCSHYYFKTHASIFLEFLLDFVQRFNKLLQKMRFFRLIFMFYRGFTVLN